MPVNSAALLKGLKPILKALDADLLKRAKDPGVEAAMRVSWKQEREASRTGDAFGTWQRRRCQQVSIAWILSVVFVRTLEDRGLISHARIAGEGAADSEAQFFALAPYLTARDYLLFVFRELASLPGAADLFDARHNPVWVLAPSDGGAKLLLDFFRRPDAKGNPPPDFDGDETRFLGDLYQDLSEDVRKRYALLQTPEFVEEFILDHTLTPAMAEFGLDGVRLIDPTCGSGHFLLGAFNRLLDAWMARSPGENRQVLAQRAARQVFGCDLNPYAVAIARFRLTMAFLQSAGIDRIDLAPRLAFNLCVADSLLHGLDHQQGRFSSVVDQRSRRVWGDELFLLDDENQALSVLGQRYNVVVGNPPYIVEPDAKKRSVYKSMYASAQARFTLSCPFFERFFELSNNGGFVGLINSNAFAKRDFGKPLVGEILRRWDVSAVVDTAGASIPGHTTPTLILFGRARPPVSDFVPLTLGRRGHYEGDEDGSSPLWREVTAHVSEPGHIGTYFTVEQATRDELAAHPWILAGGGAREMHDQIASVGPRLCTLASSVGYDTITSAANLVELSAREYRRLGVEESILLPFVVGTSIRDWTMDHERLRIAVPYDLEGDGSLLDIERLPGLKRFLWPHRTWLAVRFVSGGTTMRDVDLPYWAIPQFPIHKHETRNFIAFPRVATLGHFVHVSSPTIFKQTAPIIKTELGIDQQYGLCAYTNSSLAAFWFRLTLYPKAVQQAAPWENRLEFPGGPVGSLPVPPQILEHGVLIELGRRAAAAASKMDGLLSPTSIRELIAGAEPTAATIHQHLDERISEALELRGRLISIQEEIDWQVYEIFGFPSPTEKVVDRVCVPVEPEHRPVEVRLAREIDTDTSARIWFHRHKRTPPDNVGGPLSELYRRRLELVETDPRLQLFETAENKRRWPPIDYTSKLQTALRGWILGSLEGIVSDDQKPTAIVSVREMAQQIGRSQRDCAVMECLTGETAPEYENVVFSLIDSESVPFLAALRYTDVGLEKHMAWRELWDLQRREDAGESMGDLPKPPKYTSSDYQKGEYWNLRGTLDVPRERFILYPGAETENDTSPWIGWAGWDHLQRATALSGLYQQRKTEEGWGPDKLTPLLAGLHELVPWLIQWHNDPDPNFGGQRLGHFFRDFVAGEVQQLGLHLGVLEDWRPTAPTTRRTSTTSTGTSTRGRSPSLTPETLLAAIERLQGDGDVDLAQLSTDLDVSKQTVSKVAKACVEAGEIEQTSGRPLRFRRA